ncbi:MAG: DUF3603 family protein [Bacilli bacterium]|nr:DUF3603 family protein [Bacilli bacterium]
MNYIYDILLNFQKEFYEFYEWDNNDEIIHIRKIPFFRISSRDLKNIKNSVVKFDKTFCEKIYNKTEKFKKVKVSFLNYVCLLSDGKQVISVKLGKNGVVNYKSSLLLDEEEEIAEMAFDLKLYDIKYTVMDTNPICFLTRHERDSLRLASNKLKLLYNQKEDDKLRFLYLECFDESEDDINKIFQRLQLEVENNQKNTSKIIDFFKIISQK